MSHYKEQKIVYLTARLLAAPAFMKIANVIHNVYSKFTGASKVTVQRPIAQLIVSQPKPSRHDAIINLLNRGKNYDTAEKIVDVSADWDLDLSFLDAKNIDVKGKSVWINLED